MLPSMRKKIFINTEEQNLITIDEKTAVLINQAKKKYIFKDVRQIGIN